MMRLHITPLLVGSSLLSGCVIGNDRYQRPRDLPDSAVVDRPRILAIQAEPPEVAPGETVEFAALIGDPDGVLDLTVWLACDSGGGFGCEVDLSGLDEATPEELEAAGVIGVEPFFSPVLDVPGDALDTLTDEQKLEGLSWTIQVAAFPNSEESGQEIDFNQVEVAYKRLVVSEATTPNLNPSLRQWRVDGTPVPEDAVVTVDMGQEYELSVEVPAESVEQYIYVNSEGVAEERVEEPYLTWYANTGGFLSNLTVPLNGYDAPLSADWTAPDEPGEGTWFVVIRDRRGGQAWMTQRYRVQ